MAKTKRILIAPSQRMEMRSLAQISGIPEQYVTEAYTKSFITGGRPYDLLQITKAWLEAERDGRDYTPIFWHRTDDGVLHLTMWDMNKTRDVGIALNSMAFRYGLNTSSEL
jgi:hypothetical protein